MPNLDQITRRLEESPECRERIGRDVGSCTVALLGVFVEKGDEILRLCGSGTLVRVSGHHYILTAAHVWEALSGSVQIGITVSENLRHRFLMKTSMIKPIDVERPEKWNEWGPDLVYLLLDESYVGTIKAHSRSFYNLDVRDRPPDRDHLEAWMLFGAPAALGSFEARHAEFYIVCHYTRVEPRLVRGRFDYLDLDVKLGLPGVPQDFGGMSGGGLWHTQIWSSPDQIGIEWFAALEGVAFYQFPPVNGHRILRCHGLQSILTTLPHQ